MNQPYFCVDCGTRFRSTPVQGLCPGCLLRAGLDRDKEPPSPEALTQRFPQWEVLESIGSGGMGAVYRARQLPLDRVVALKILWPRSSVDAAFSERFLREARALARLNHPNIVTVHDFGQDGELHYLLMEYVDGTNLREAMDRAALQPAQILAIVQQVCDALQYAHDQGVVHRDIKPENILLDRSGRVKIADFGLAKLMHPTRENESLTGPRQVMGTPRYMAPEQIEGSPGVDHRADIYSLGIVLYEMLTGELPLGRFEPPSRRAAVDARLDEVVLKTLERAPDRRYQAAREVKTALHDASTPRAPECRVPTESMAEEAMGLVLCIGIPLLVVLGIAWTQTAWPVIGLFIPGVGLGHCVVDPTRRNENAFMAVVITLLGLGCIGAGIWIMRSPWPLVGLAVLFTGMGRGMDEFKARLASPSGEDAGASPDVARR